MKKILLTAAVLAAILTVSFQTILSSQDDENIVNLYSARHYQVDEQLYSDFTEQTGIKVNIIEANGNALIERMKNEGDNSPADIYISVDVGTLWRADQEDIFGTVVSSVLDERIPQHLRHPEGKWFGFASRARVIVYNKELVDPNDISTYEDLADEQWRSMVCIRSSGNIYNQSLLASLIAHHGVADAEAWAAGVVANFARQPQGGDTDQIKAVASGECGIGVANSYYYARLMNSDDPADQAVVEATGVIFPNQNDRGTHVNISGAGVVKNAPHHANAVRFLEYLASDSAQSFFANSNNEYPTATEELDNPALIALGAFKSDDINISIFGVNQAEAQRIFDRVGWN